MKKFLKAFIIIFIVFIIALSYLYLSLLPVIGDSALYSQSILEIQRSGKATYLGYKETWKSPIFFYIYSFFTKPLSLFIKEPYVFSIPCVIFYFFSAFFLYKILRIFFDENFSTIALFIFSLNPLSALIFSTPFNEAELMPFLLGSVYFYFISYSNSIFLIPASIFLAFSFGIKSYEALIIPFLSIFYFIEKRAKKKDFILLSLSFSSIAIPIFLNAFVFKIGEMFMYDLKHFSIGINNLSFIKDFLIFLFPFSIFSFFGLRKNKEEKEKKERTRIFDFWFFFIIPVFFFESGTPWYYSPLLPAIAVLSTSFFRKENKFDYLIIFFILFLCFFSSMFIIHEVKTIPDKISFYGGLEEIELAKTLAKKDNVLLLYYSPTFVFYYSYYSNYSLSVYWFNFYYPSPSSKELEEALSFYGENITSWNKWYYNEIKAIYANPRERIDFIVLRDIDYSQNSQFFSQNGYYPYIVLSRILVLKKF
ncbi:MAG: hypothetical protein ACP5FX_00450 [Candidatus Micrarchaeia archaeon]